MEGALPQQWGVLNSCCLSPEPLSPRLPAQLLWKADTLQANSRPSERQLFDSRALLATLFQQACHTLSAALYNVSRRVGCFPHFWLDLALCNMQSSMSVPDDLVKDEKTLADDI